MSGFSPRTDGIRAVSQCSDDQRQSHRSWLRLGSLFAAATPPDRILHLLVEEVTAQLPCRHAALWLRRPDTEGYFCAAVYEDSQDAAESLRGLVVETDNFPVPDGFFTGLSAIHTRLKPFSEFLPAGTRYVAMTPIHSGRDEYGLLYAVNSGDDTPFGPEEQETLRAIAGQAALFTEVADLREWKSRRTERENLLEHIRQCLQQTLDLEQLISRIFSEVNQALDAEAQSIWLVNAEQGNIACRFATGPGADKVKQVTVPLGQGIVGSTVSRQESILVADAQTDARHSRLADNRTGLTTHSLMSVPMVRDGQAVGAIQAMNKHNGVFDNDDLELLRSIADIAALAIENTRLFADLRRSYDTTLEALTAALDARDHETEGHSRRVVEYAARIARQMGMSYDEIQVLRRGALIHDIGKIAVPDNILHKPGPLTVDEYHIMQNHPRRGYEMLKGIPHLRREVEIVLTHQEHWDGTGYPLGLRGTDIPVGARVFMIADTFDAILSDRPYRRGRAYDAACRVITEESGKQFDPAVVEAFLAVPPHEWEEIRGRVAHEVVRGIREVS